MMTPAETIFEIIAFVLGTALLIAMVVGIIWIGGILFAICAGATLVLGWVPILVVYNDPTLSFTFAGGFWEVWGIISLLTYGLIAAGIVGGWLFVSNGGDLPRGLKIIAWLFPHPATREVERGTRRSLTHGVDGKALSRALDVKPATAVGRRVQRHQAEKLAKNLKSEGDWLEAQTKVGREALTTERKRGTALGYSEAHRAFDTDDNEVDPEKIRAYAEFLKRKN